VDSRQNKIVADRKYDYQVHEIQWSSQSDFMAMATGAGGMGSVEFVGLNFLSLSSYVGHTTLCNCVKFDPVRRNRFASASYDGMVALWDGDLCTRTIDRIDHPIRAICYSNNGQYLFSASEELTIDMAYAETGLKKASIPVERTKIELLACHPHLPLVVYAGEELHDATRSGHLSVVKYA